MVQLWDLVVTWLLLEGIIFRGNWILSLIFIDRGLHVHTKEESASFAEPRRWCRDEATTFLHDFLDYRQSKTDPCIVYSRCAMEQAKLVEKIG